MTLESQIHVPTKKHGNDTGADTKKKSKVVRAASKTTAIYWSKVIFRLQKGEWESSNYFVRFKLHNQRKRVRLESTTREEAGREALAEYLKILTNGWPVEGTISVPETSELSKNPTVKEWVAVAMLKARVRQGSVAKYGESLRTVVGEILGMRRARKNVRRQLRLTPDDN